MLSLHHQHFSFGTHPTKTTRNLPQAMVQAKFLLLPALTSTVFFARDAAAKKSDVAKLPNGGNVPGVPAIGHTDVSGKGPANDFGDDFETVGYVWTKEFCQADTDGDGQTNGQELGDPCCAWVKGSNEVVLWTTGVSHPGDATLKSDSSLWADITCVGTTAVYSTPSPSPGSTTSTPSTTTTSPTTTKAPSSTTATPSTTSVSSTATASNTTTASNSTSSSNSTTTSKTTSSNTTMPSNSTTTPTPTTTKPSTTSSSTTTSGSSTLIAMGIAQATVITAISMALIF